MTPLTFLSPDMTIGGAAASFDGSEERTRFVGEAGAFHGTVSAATLREAVVNGRGDEPLGVVVRAPVVHAHPDHTVAVLVERLAHCDGALPIVSRRDARVVLGVVTVEGIMRGLRGGVRPPATE